MLAHAGAVDESLAVAMIFAALWVGWIGWSKLRGTGFPRMPRWGGGALLVAAAALLVAAAIVPRAIFGPTPDAPTVDDVVATGERPASTASLDFVEPVDGARVDGDQLEVVLDLEGGRVVEEATTEVVPDEGHIHLTLDGRIVSMTYGTVQVVDVRALAPGEHTLEAEFVAADHAPFSPRVLTDVTVVREGE
jgi:hypothetical protein